MSAAGGGRLKLGPGDVCHPPAGLSRVLDRLTRYQLEDLLIDIAVWHREAFEEALANQDRLYAPPEPGTHYGPI